MENKYKVFIIIVVPLNDRFIGNTICSQGIFLCPTDDLALVTDNKYRGVSVSQKTLWVRHLIEKGLQENVGTPNIKYTSYFSMDTRPGIRIEIFCILNILLAPF